MLIGQNVTFIIVLQWVLTYWPYASGFQELKRKCAISFEKRWTGLLTHKYWFEDARCIMHLTLNDCSILAFEVSTLSLKYWDLWAFLRSVLVISTIYRPTVDFGILNFLTNIWSKFGQWTSIHQYKWHVFKERIRRANELRRAATRAFIGEHQNISNKNATLRKINSNNRLPSNYTEQIEVYSNDTKPSLWRKPLGQIGPVIKLKVWGIYIQWNDTLVLKLGLPLEID